MKESLKGILVLILTVFVLTACGSNSTNVKVNSDKTNKVALVEKQIEESGYVISIPADYSIVGSDGPDFSVYYFSPTDTTLSDKLSAGLYFGNFPNAFEADSDNCKMEKLKGEILDTLSDWTVYNCQGNYSIQTIIDNKKNEGWNQKIHAFGYARSRDELEVILEIFSTLEKKKQQPR